MKNILLTQWCTFCQSFFYVKVKSKKTVRERVTANFVPLKTNNLFKGKVSKYICFCKRYCKTSLCYYFLLKLLLVVKVNYHYKIEMCYVPSKSVSRSQTKFYYVKSLWSLSTLQYIAKSFFHKNWKHVMYF